jgi:hypothetical protein
MELRAGSRVKAKLRAVTMFYHVFRCFAMLQRLLYNVLQKSEHDEKQKSGHFPFSSRCAREETKLKRPCPCILIAHGPWMHPHPPPFLPNLPSRSHSKTLKQRHRSSLLFLPHQGSKESFPNPSSDYYC